MDQKPWYQKLKTDPSFPFLFEDNTFQDYAFHWHEPLEVIYVLEGEISIVVEGNVYHTVKRDIIIINSGVIHAFREASKNVIISTYQFGAEFFDHYLFDMREKTSQKLVFCRKTFITFAKEGEIHRRLEEALLSIRTEYMTQNKGFRLAIRMRLYEIALIFLRDFPYQEPCPEELAKQNRNHQRLERIFSFIYDNLSNPNITMEQAAEAAALSTFYFTRYFKQQVGQNFHNYLSLIRIKQAEKYLVDSDFPIIDIAYECGFSSLKTFNRVFKTYSGTTPSCYRSGKKSSL